MKIYVHHYYSKQLLYKLAHNLTDKLVETEDNKKIVTGKYKDTTVTFVFDPELHDKEDGLHLLDYYTAGFEIRINPTYQDLVTKKKDSYYDRRFLVKFNELLADRKGWIVTCFSTEKILCKYDSINYPLIVDFEAELDKLKDHYIVHDNIIFNNHIREKYTNHFFALTNTIHQWNELMAIRWYYEYKNIFEKLQPPHDLCYSVRNHRKSRVKILNGLARLKNHRIYLSTVDNLQNKNFKAYSNQLEENIHRNINSGDDFEDIEWHQTSFPIVPYMDYFMRILPMAKMHIVSETWDFEQVDFTSNYLSEKTYGFLLGNIPFIATHPYPLEIVQHLLNIEPYPFYREIKSIKGNPEEFVSFVAQFMKNFDKNYTLCKEWVNCAHNKLIEKINTENSLLDLVSVSFKYKVKRVEKTLL